MKKGGPDYSDEKAFRIAFLISGFIRKTLRKAEHDELDAWVEADDHNMRLFEELTDEAHLAANLQWMDRIQTEKALQARLHALRIEERSGMERRTWWPYAAAACLIAVVFFAYFITRVSSNPSGTGTTIAQRAIVPGGYRATLTLSNGEVMELEDANRTSLHLERGTSIQTKRGGEIAYVTTTELTNVPFNTLTTPRGGQYAITLEDGTRVWLNAASSLRYPVQFVDSNRVVELKGEGFFEVAKNVSKPFIVQLSGGEAVRVLGTQFNVKSYVEDEKKEVTLLEGRVQVEASGSQWQLKPGQQAFIGGSGVLLQKVRNMDASVSWKRGSFVFDDASVYELMRQLERWYDVDVVFNTTSKEHFNFTISRGEPLSKVLRLMELTGKIHFKTENKTVYVLP